jgi:hypothetical protein
MKPTRRTYVLTLHAPSRSALRIWTGKDLHALRHCSATQIGRVLTEMQQHLDHLRRAVKPAASDGSQAFP